VPQINVRRWNGSLATSLDPEQTVPGDFTRLRNFIYNDTGLPTVRGGRRIWGSGISAKFQESGSPQPIRGLFYFKQGGTTNRPRDFIIGYGGTKIKYGTDPITGPWTEIQTGLDSGLKPSFASLRDWVIFASDSEIDSKPRFWNGQRDVMKIMKDAPDSHIVAVHANRAWYVDQNSPSKITYSALFEPDNFNVSQGSGSLFIGPGDGGVITALVPGFSGEMIIFKDSPSGGSTWRLAGLSELDFTVSSLSQTIGSIGPATMVGDKDVFFGSRRGIHSLKRVIQFGDLESANIDTEISGLWRDLPDKQKMAAVAVDDYTMDTWYLFIDTDLDGLNDHGWLFNYRHRGPRGNPKISEVTFGAESATMIQDHRMSRNFLMTGNADGFTRTENHPEASDQTSFSVRDDITWEMHLHPIDANDAFGVKAWKTLWLKHDIWGESNFDVRWFGDNQRPTIRTISMNPAGIPTPFVGGVRANESRYSPSVIRTQNVVNLQRGGTAITIQIAGTRGRTTFRGLTLNYETGAPNVTVGQWFPYTEARQKVHLQLHKPTQVGTSGFSDGFSDGFA